jgi:Family of unknown function (DUF6370)
MRSILVIFTFLLATIAATAQDKAAAGKTPQKAVVNKVVEASCGQCQFSMKGKSCDLAIRIDGKAYFVDGTSIDDHGDAHAKDGFCQKVRKALVSGHIEGIRFKATSFKLLPE